MDTRGQAAHAAMVTVHEAYTAAALAYREGAPLEDAVPVVVALAFDALAAAADIAEASGRGDARSIRDAADTVAALPSGPGRRVAWLAR